MGRRLRNAPKHTLPHAWLARPLTLQRQTRLEGTGFMLHTLELQRVEAWSYLQGRNTTGGAWVAEQAPESWPEGTGLPPCPPLPRHLLGPAGLLWENRPAHMMLAGVKTGPTHKVSVISQPQDRGLHTSSASWSSPGSSCPRSASLRTGDKR